MSLRRNASSFFPLGGGACMDGGRGGAKRTDRGVRREEGDR